MFNKHKWCVGVRQTKATRQDDSAKQNTEQCEISTETFYNFLRHDSIFLNLPVQRSFADVENFSSILSIASSRL